MTLFFIVINYENVHIQATSFISIVLRDEFSSVYVCVLMVINRSLHFDFERASCKNLAIQII